jgi:DNA polymerase-3 subunit psi
MAEQRIPNPRDGSSNLSTPANFLNVVSIHDTIYPMSNFSRYYLQQMGITLWQCHKPEYFPHLPNQAEKITLPKNCRILIISNDRLAAHSQFISQILHTLQLDFNQSHTISEEELKYYYQVPDWIWTIGCVQSTLAAERQLSSPSLDVLLHSGKAKKQLWQQIVHNL